MTQALSLPRLHAGLRHVAGLRATAALALTVGILLLMMIPPNGVPNDNEEHYLHAAHQYLDPQAVPAESALLGGMPHAFAFYAVAGVLLKAVNFETAQMLGRLLAVLLYTITITRLFRALSLSALDAALVLVAFYLTGQYLMGEEWLFRGFEPKVLAYPAVFLALTEIVRSRLLRAFLWLAVATWFHFLVGALWLGIVVIALFIERRPLRELAICSGAYAAAVAPLLGYLLLRNYGAAPLSEQAGLPTVGWIITHFREAHHSAPYASLWTFMAWLPGTLAAAVIAIVSATYARTLSGEWRRLALIVCVACVYLLLAMLAAAFDRDGFLGPFTIFRPSSLALFLALVLAAHWVDSIGTQAATLKLAALGIVLAVVLPKVAVDAVGPVRDQMTAHAQVAPLYRFIAESTPTDARFLIGPKVERSFLSFERRSNRAAVVINKFVPAEPHDVLEWYRRRLFQEALFANGCTDPAPYRVDYLIAATDSARMLTPTCGPIVFEHAGIAVIRRTPAPVHSAEQ
jgi:hypothetical protein